MYKTLQKCANYTPAELNSYVAQEGACVRKINSNFHMSIGPHILSDFKRMAVAHIQQKKVGCYDRQLNGIVLDVRNIKVQGQVSAVRADDAHLHVDINADFYVFCPEVGAVLSGIVKHIGRQHVGVVIYRVFNAHLRLGAELKQEKLSLDEEVKFCVKNFDLQSHFPYIEGALVGEGWRGSAMRPNTARKINFTETDTVEVKEEGTEDLDELVSLIGNDEETNNAQKTPKKRKRKHMEETVEETEMAAPKVKKEKRSSKSRDGTSVVLASKRKRISETHSSDDSGHVEDCTDETPSPANLLTPIKIKIKVEKESPKKRKTKTKVDDALIDDVVVKMESEEEEEPNSKRKRKSAASNNSLNTLEPTKKRKSKKIVGRQLQS